MIDATTGRYCLAHSMHYLWNTGNVVVALDGLPTRTEVKAHPLPDLLCEFHRWYFVNMPIVFADRNADGTIKMRPDNPTVAQLQMKSSVPRPYGPTIHDLSRLDLLTILERMERGLRLLQQDYAAGFVYDETVQDTCTLEDVIERAAAVREAERILSDALTPNANLYDTRAPHGLYDIDDDDRISGEE